MFLNVEEAGRKGRRRQRGGGRGYRGKRGCGGGGEGWPVGTYVSLSGRCGRRLLSVGALREKVASMVPQSWRKEGMKAKVWDSVG